MEIKSEINHFNINKICRTCLMEKNVMKAVFAPDESIGKSIAERIMDFTNIQLEVGDGLPSLICLDCVHQADIAYSFKQLCEKSDRNLRQFLERPPIIVDIKKEEEEIEATDNSLFDKDFSMFMDIKQKEEMEVTDYKVHVGSNDIITQEEGDEKNDQPFLCNICGINCKYRSYLERHLRTHTGERPFPCEICHKKYTKKANLKIHMMIHRNERPFECNICQKRFTHASKLKAHMMTHKNEKRFECNTCQKKFTQMVNLKVHMMGHRNEKPFECNVCQRRFTSKKLLRVHVRIHTDERPFACEFCEKTFRQSHHLKRHKLMHVTKTN